MGGIVGTLATAAGMWAGTNVDDLIVLTVLFLSLRAAGAPKAWQIWVGQYCGIAILVALSMIAALGLAVIADGWVGLLGLVPFALGLRGLIATIRARNSGEHASMAVSGGALSVASVTIANGGDNISVYTPVFHTIGTGASVVTIIAFFVALAVWCLAGSWLSSHKKVVEVIERYGHWIVPVVYVVIGTLVLRKSGVIGKIF
ncbi:cadmium resistance transporter [Microtetraspora malaysiensis]|uniref:cadmium resistance transporter n=1 Tax=Microtetraspora malaysiensis TaxID=161358 RepID=UPI000A033565|nr:cadmium resistance transporter [Microtetraspora malaysiensis]